MTAPASISESPKIRLEKLFSHHDRRDQGDEQRHATRIERAAVIGGRKAQPSRRHQRIRRADPGDKHAESKPSKAVAGKASPHEDRREEETRDAEAQRRDVRCIRGWS